MNGAAVLTEVQLFATHDAFSEAEFYESEILLCHTTLDGLTTSFEANYGGNTPFSARRDDTLSIDWTAPGWNGLPFDSPFDYNGTDNLILEFRYLGEDGRTINTKGFYPPTPNRTLDAGLPTSPSGDLLGFMNSLRIYYTPGTGIEGEGPPCVDMITVEASPSGSPVFLLSLPEPGPARLGLYSSEGRMVWGWSDPTADSGGRTVSDVPADLPSGVYVAVLEACGRSSSARLVLLRQAVP